MKSNPVLCLLLMVVLFLSSCVAHKEMVVMQENEKLVSQLKTWQEMRQDKMYDPASYRIKVHDQLMIRIKR